MGLEAVDRESTSLVLSSLPKLGLQAGWLQEKVVGISVEQQRTRRT